MHSTIKLNFSGKWFNDFLHLFPDFRARHHVHFINIIIKEDDQAQSKFYHTYVPGQGVEHLVLSTWFSSHIGPPHLGMGLSHFRSLLWKPWPQLELQSDHSDHVDHPPLTVVKDKVGVHFSPGKKYRNLVLLHWYFSFRRSTSIFGLFDLRSVLHTE